jgi:hypothetical protein
MSHFTQSTSAVVMLLAVWGVILINMLYCFYKLLTSERQLGGDDHE